MTRVEMEVALEADALEDGDAPHLRAEVFSALIGYAVALEAKDATNAKRSLLALNRAILVAVKEA